MKVKTDAPSGKGAVKKGKGGKKGKPIQLQSPSVQTCDLNEEDEKKARELNQMKECEERVSKWRQLNDQLCEPKLSDKRRGELRGQIKLIDPQYNTGTVGGIPSAKKKARRIREKYFNLEIQGDEERWTVKTVATRQTNKGWAPFKGKGQREKQKR